MTGTTRSIRLDELNAARRGPEALGRCRARPGDDARAQPAGGRGRAPAPAGAAARGRARAWPSSPRRRATRPRSPTSQADLARLSETGRPAPAREHALGRGRRQRLLPRGQCRRRRHRVAGLGRDAAAHVHALGRAARLQGGVDRGEPGRGGRDQVGHGQGHRPERLWLAQDRDRRASPGAHLALRQPVAAPHQLRQRLGLSRWSTTGSRSRSTTRTCGSTPTAPRAPAASTSTGPTARSASPTCRPASSSPARPTARSTATAPRPWTCCAPGSTSSSCRSGARRAEAIEAPARPTSAGATRSAPTSCSPTRWSRTCAPASRTATRRRVLDGDLDGFLEAALAQGAGSKRMEA